MAISTNKSKNSKRSIHLVQRSQDLSPSPEWTCNNSQATASDLKYVNNIAAISISTDRRHKEDEPVTEEERHLLRGLVGSLQHAAVHTRPDLSSALSHLQSQINKAKVSTLIKPIKLSIAPRNIIMCAFRYNQLPPKMSASLHFPMPRLHPQANLNLTPV